MRDGQAENRQREIFQIAGSGVAACGSSPRASYRVNHAECSRKSARARNLWRNPRSGRFTENRKRKVCSRLQEELEDSFCFCGFVLVFSRRALNSSLVGSRRRNHACWYSLEVRRKGIHKWANQAASLMSSWIALAHPCLLSLPSPTLLWRAGRLSGRGAAPERARIGGDRSAGTGTQRGCPRNTTLVTCPRRKSTPARMPVNSTESSEV